MLAGLRRWSKRWSPASPRVRRRAPEGVDRRQRPGRRAELRAYVDAQVAPYKRLVAIEVVDELPRTMTGKLLRRVLVERERTAVPYRHDARPMSRFSEPQDPIFRRLNASIGFDWRLAPYDVEQSRAHATMLAAAGIISEDERDALLNGPRPGRGRARGGRRSAFEPDDEDIHMAIERRLTEIVGPVGGKLHTARSRNDQVATDMAMFTRAHALADARGAQRAAGRCWSQLADRHLDWPMPGYTHLQRAQPVYLVAPPARLLLDVPRATRGASSSCCGSTERPAARRGRARRRELRHRPPARSRASSASTRWRRTRSTRSPTATSCSTSCAAAATCATHLSRLGAEIVLWSSEEFGFCEVSDAWASGSSIMPQKKNPDAAELLRAKAPRVAAHLSGAARRAARPAADLQQGPAGGQGAPVRRGRHARSLPGGGARDARGRSRSTASAWRRRPPTS